MAGEIPILDFRSYDPGRYYWIAAWLKLLGKGLANFRISTSIFQFIGLTLALLALNKHVKKYWILTIVGILITIWVWPYFKVFEVTMCITTIYGLSLLIEKPSIKRHFLIGIMIGLAGFFGKNTGLYSLLAYILTVSYLLIKKSQDKTLKSITSACIGIITGYLPIIIMILTIDGFWTAFLKSINRIVSKGATNLPLPFPWPWEFQQYTTPAIYSISLGLLFIFIPLFFAYAAILLINKEKNEIKRYSLLAASIFAGAPWIHYAFSRADISHIARVIPSLIIAITTLFFIEKNNKGSKIIKTFSLIIIIIFSITIIIPKTPLYLKMTLSEEHLSPIQINNSSFLIQTNNAKIIKNIQKINSTLINPSEELLMIPHLPTLYPILNRKSPILNSYLIISQSKQTQYEEIEQSKNVDWVILCNDTFDKREDLLFTNTNPIFYKYLKENFEQIDAIEISDKCELLKKK